MLDVDLNEPLPFRAGSIDAFTGLLISNVAGYRALLNEIARCLKPGGRFAVAEIFFEKGSETYRQLVHENAVYAPFDDYVSCCKENGLIDKGGALVKKLAGKIDPDDLLPLNDTDTSKIRTAFFEKAKVLHRSAALSLSVKGIARSNWPRIIDRSGAFMPLNEDMLIGEAGLLRLNRVEVPLEKSYDGHTIRILADGYYWPQLAPTGKNYWLTAMYDGTGAFIQFYFDVTDRQPSVPVCHRMSESTRRKKALYLSTLLSGKSGVLSRNGLYGSLRVRHGTRGKGAV